MYTCMCRYVACGYVQICCMRVCTNMLHAGVCGYVACVYVRICCMRVCADMLRACMHCVCYVFVRKHMEGWVSMVVRGSISTSHILHVCMDCTFDNTMNSRGYLPLPFML